MWQQHGRQMTNGVQFYRSCEILKHKFHKSIYRMSKLVFWSMYCFCLMKIKKIAILLVIVVCVPCSKPPKYVSSSLVGVDALSYWFFIHPAQQYVLVHGSFYLRLQKLTQRFVFVTDVEGHIVTFLKFGHYQQFADILANTISSVISVGLSSFSNKI